MKARFVNIGVSVAKGKKENIQIVDKEVFRILKSK